MMRTNGPRARPDRFVRRAGRFGASALLFAGGAVWLLLAAVPVMADGGPHISVVNNGSAGINADSCAGCHRTHTAQGQYLINQPNEEALCLSCHGAVSVGATTDVMTGVQYAVRGAAGVAGAQLGALRNGGFEGARMDTSAAARQAYNGTGIEFVAKVGVLVSPEDVTSAHIDLDGTGGVASAGIAWGNGANGSGSGPTVPALSCASCHNPHGNGQYRILNPIPRSAATTGTFVPVIAPGVVVDDSPLGTPVANAYPTKNYTVIQTRGTEGTDSTFKLYASQVTSGATSGDYFHRYVPWNETSNFNRSADGPNGKPSTFNTQMTSWCLSCHTRYYSATSDVARPGDTTFKYQHQTVTRNTVCTTCHVAHGSNAKMYGPFSKDFTQPNGSPSSTSVVTSIPGPNPPGTPVAVTSGDSRLLKFDNRGTCNACHDPTDTVLAGDYTGPVPVPGVP